MTIYWPIGFARIKKHEGPKQEIMELPYTNQALEKLCFVNNVNKTKFPPFVFSLEVL